jgi:hypothetical protein
MGGFCIQLDFMWRLSRDDLASFGFPMYEDEPKKDEEGLHINILEFIAIIITLWMALRRVKPGEQPIVLATADNTSALSWMAFAARTKRPVVRRLARFCQALLTYCPYHFALQKAHVKGEANEDADILSRFKRAASWRAVIDSTSQALRNCQPYQVPSELLSTLQELITSERPAAWYATRTTDIWTVEPTILPPGWLQSDTMTSRC